MYRRTLCRLPRWFALAAVVIASKSSAQPVAITTPTTIGPSDTTITPSGGGTPVLLSTAQITVSATTLTISGVHEIASIALVSSAVLNHPAGVAGTHLTISGALTIELGSTINLNGRGESQGMGVGAGTSSTTNLSGSGAGHGGFGGHNNNFSGGPAYGSPSAPVTLGSGGGYGANNPVQDAGGPGGGAIRLSVGGTLAVDGTISANGLNGLADATSGRSGGGGSGGSIYINAGTLSGTGTITANGGNSPTFGGGGAGGRIAVYADSISLATTNLRATGGTGAGRGGAGTIYVMASSAPLPTLILDAGGAPLAAPTPIGGLQNLLLLTVSNGANALFDAGCVVSQGLTILNAAAVTGTTLTLSGSLSVAGGSRLVLSTPSGLTLSGDVTITGAGSFLQISDNLTVPGNLSILAGGDLRHPNTDSGLFVSVTGNATVGAGSTINLNGRGESQGMGVGAGTSSTTNLSGSGAGHGGFGGHNNNFSGGPAYGSPSAPVTLGSGGGYGYNNPVQDAGGPGGGAIRLSVGGTLAVDGTISANGLNGLADDTSGRSGGGGSGGSIYINAGTLSGTGTITANGGNSPTFGGGGAGGRIAVYVCATSATTPQLHVLGGSGAGNGQTGTIRNSCPADFNCSGGVSVQDIFDFLAAYFNQNPRADVNLSGAISVQDLFDFLMMYFAGCP